VPEFGRAYTIPRSRADFEAFLFSEEFLSGGLSGRLDGEFILFLNLIDNVGGLLMGEVEEVPML
jgi:hypothetical protein